MIFEAVTRPNKRLAAIKTTVEPDIQLVHNPEHLPFSWKILLSGYVPKYVYDSGVLDQSSVVLEHGTTSSPARWVELVAS